MKIILLASSLVALILNSCAPSGPKTVACPNGEIVVIYDNPTAAYASYASGYDTSISDLQLGLKGLPVAAGLENLEVKNTITQLEAKLNNESIQHRDALRGMIQATSIAPCRNLDTVRQIKDYSLDLQKSSSNLKLQLQRLEFAKTTAQTLPPERSEAFLLEALRGVSEQVDKSLNQTKNRGGVPPEGEKVDSVYFSLGSSDIRESEKASIQKIQNFARTSGNGTFLLVGRTDGVAPGRNSKNESNFALARARAGRVATAAQIKNFQITAAPSLHNQTNSEELRRVDVIWFQGKTRLKEIEFANSI